MATDDPGLNSNGLNADEQQVFDALYGATAGATRRGVPADYDGSNPRLCNARTKSGRPCRAARLARGRCKWHGGLSTGPRTPEGKARALANLAQNKKPKETAS